jgi:hypothetical protein
MTDNVKTELERLNFNSSIQLLAGKGRRQYRCRFVKAGRVRSGGNRPSNIEVTETALVSAFNSQLFEAKAVFIDHSGFFEYPSLSRLAGVTSDIEYDPASKAILGTVTLYSSMRQVADLLDELLAEGKKAPDVGLSIVFWPIWSDNHDDDKVRRIIDIKHVESVDLVFEPAADGRILEALSAAAQGAVDLDVYTSNTGGTFMPEQPNTTGTQPAAAQTQPPAGDPNALVGEWLKTMATASAGVMIANSGLPAASRERLGSRIYAAPEEVQQAIDSERAYLARLTEDNIINISPISPRTPQISMGMTGFDQLELAIDAMVAGVRPDKNVRPLSGIRELYLLLSGDFEMEGLYHSDRIQFANVNSSTMAGMVANALNKRVMNEFMQYPRWWEPICLSEDFDSLQAVKWVTLGGVGELPTVAEGAAYTELTWDDMTETATFVKKGGYLGLTLEAIDKDDTRRLRAAPRALAQAAWLTLGKAISYIFTQASGLGPTMSDGHELFDSSGHHSNYVTSALSLTAWNVASASMRAQTELNSSTPLGALTRPKFLLVPPELEVTALQILATDKDYLYALSNGVAAPENVNAYGNERMERLTNARERVIVVDLWTDATDWHAICDPNLWPTIGIGFRYGRVPEVFSVASPTAGLMFSNDTLPVKVRFFFAVAPIDYRGMYKGLAA